MAKVYLGETEIAPVVTAEVPEKRFGVGINNILGRVDEEGVYTASSRNFFIFDGKGIKRLAGNNGLTYAFSHNIMLTFIKFEDLEEIEAGGLSYTCNSCSHLSGDIVFDKLVKIGPSGMAYCFQNIRNDFSVSFPSLVEVGTYGLNYCLSQTYVKSVSFPKLKTVSDSGLSYFLSHSTKIVEASFPLLESIGVYGFQSALTGCSNFASISFPALKSISANAFVNCFVGTVISSISFPALESVASSSFGESTYNYAFRSITTLTEIHFPAAIQSQIESMTGYDTKWGATNATIYFDL